MYRLVYDATTPRQVLIILDCYIRARLGKPFAQELAKLGPLASIVSIEERGDHAVAVNFAGRSPRIMDDVTALLLCAFTIYKTAPIFSASREHGDPEEHLYIYCPNHIALHRSMAGALSGERVLLGPDHRDLRPSSGLRIVGAPKATTTDARSKALATSLTNHVRHAEALGLADLMTSDEYRDLLLDIYLLLDRRFGHILRPPAVAAE